MAKSEKVAKKVTRLFQDRKIEKTYLTIVTGLPKEHSGTINYPIIKKRQPNGKEVMQITKKQEI